MTRRRYARPPSVAEYARLTRAARLEAAEALHAMRLARRPGPPARTCHDHTPEETLMLAHVLLPIVARRWPDPVHVQRDRLQAARAEMDAWVSPRTRARRAA